jgi:hypothetical protein
MTILGRAGLRRAARPALAVLVATATLLVVAATACAESASISVTTTGGQPDAAAYVPRLFTVAGDATTGKNLYVKHRAVGGDACAPSAYSDPGSSWTGFYGLPVNGTFSFQKAVTWDSSGTWMFCFWLASDEREIATPISQAVTFRAPAVTMAPTLSPPVPRPGQRARLTVPGVSEAPRTLFAKVRQTDGSTCAPSYDAALGQSLFSGENVDGAFTGQAITVQNAPGRYTICFWVAGSSFDPAPVQVQSLTFGVVQPRAAVSSVSALNCETRQSLHGRILAQKVHAICLRYRFSTPPGAGARVAVSFVTPSRRTYKTVSVAWPGGATTMTTRALPGGAYVHRLGTWRAVLRVDGAWIMSRSFRVA